MLPDSSESTERPTKDTISECSPRNAAQAGEQYAQTQVPARVFTEFLYATEKTWNRERRVIAKAEHLDKGANPRFVVTSLSTEQMAAQELYEKGYCARGDCPENRIKEQQLARPHRTRLWTRGLRSRPPGCASGHRGRG